MKIAGHLNSKGFKIRIQGGDLFTDATKDDIFKVAKEIKEEIDGRD